MISLRIKSPKPKIRFLAALIAAIAICDDSGATTFVPTSIDEEVSQSDAILYVEIKDSIRETVGNETCGVRYRADVLDLFKAPSKSLVGSEIYFGRTEGLLVNHTYLLFLRYIPDSETVLATIPPDLLSKETPKHARELVTCNNLIPGFNLDPTSSWETHDDEVKIVGLRPSPWPKSIMIYKEFLGESIVSKDALFSYLRRLTQD